MFATYLKITFRHLVKNKLYSSINAFGLAVGIWCVLLAVLYWKDERSFDTFHQNRYSLYRITTTLRNKDGKRITSGGTAQVQGPAFKEGVPEISDYVRLLGGGITGDVLANNKGLNLKFLFADTGFFKMFSFNLLRGNPQTALKDINNAVITQSVALKFFNSIDVVGKELTIDADPSAQKLGKPMVITGVVKDFPANSSIRCDVLLPFAFMQLSFNDDYWLNSTYLSTFVTLRPNADINTVTQKIDKVYLQNATEEIAGNIRSYGYDRAFNYGLQPITDIHLHPYNMDQESGVVNGSSPVFSWLFMGIAVFILLMASINFINISIADSLKRAKEVGIRKISGGSRPQIIMQFLCESAVLCLIAFAVAILLTNVSLPLFNTLTGKHILPNGVFNIKLLANFILILAVIILFTGFYPAWVLSRFSAKEALYNKQKLSGSSVFGKGLVVLQFSFAVFLVIATLVYYRQMNFIRTKDLGYNPHEIVQTQIPGNRVYMPVYRFLRTELAKEPAIKGLSFGSDWDGSVGEVKLKGRKMDAVNLVIDENYLSVMGIQLKAGRNINPASFPSDSDYSALVNEAFVRESRLANPLGTTITTDDYLGSASKTIVGVVKDYHLGSLREPIKPMVMAMNVRNGGNILVKLEKAHAQEGLAALEKAYKKAIPNAVYQYQFLDELNAQQYEQEQRWQRLISVATALSIAICCLGLFGLAHLSAKKREKEIGIRKVLGATVAQVVSLLSASFLKLVMVAIVIAAPLGWLVMNKWLQDFAYRIDIGAGIFIAAGLIAVCIALIAVTAQAVKAAIANPVDSLRTE